MATCLHPINVRGTLVPCGKCPICTQNKRQLLANRMLLESAFCGGPTYFITLTYNDSNLPYCSRSIDNDRWIIHTKDWFSSSCHFNHGAYYECFDKSHIQKFNKSLRKCGLVYSYFFTAERGDFSHRCHYHALLFFRSDVEPSRLSELVTRYWPYGLTKISLANDARIAYASKYCLKDDFSNDTVLSNDDPRKTFRLFSCRPGLGQSCIDFLNEYIYNGGNIRKTLLINGKNITFDRFLKNHIDPSLAEEVRSLTYYDNLEEIQERLLRSFVAHSKKDPLSQMLTSDYTFDKDIMQSRYNQRMLKKCGKL